MSYRERYVYLGGNCKILNIPGSPPSQCDRKKGSAMLENSPRPCSAKQTPYFGSVRRYREEIKCLWKAVGGSC